MRKSRFTESQIVQTLKEIEGGQKVKDVCRELGIFEATSYRWKSVFVNILVRFFMRPERPMELGFGHVSSAG